MKRSILLLALLPLMGPMGCQKETSPSGTESPLSIHEKPVKIHTSLADSQNATKALVQGTEIPENFSYGIFVCTEDGANKQDAHKANSWNLKSTYARNLEGALTWSFQYVDNFKDGTLSANTYDHITITSRDDHKTADLYAYAPHIKGTFNPTAVPVSIAYSVANQTDLMYAAENISRANTGLNPEGDEPLNANFTFKHALSLLAFNFHVKYYETEQNYRTRYELQRIRIRKNNPNATLFSSGTFDITTGQFNEDECTSTETIEISPYDNGEYPGILSDRTIYIAMIPTQFENEDLVIEFQMNNQTVRPFVLKKEYLKHGDSDDYGFLSGFKYTFNFTLDNYLYLTGFAVDKWDNNITYFNQEI